MGQYIKSKLFGANIEPACCYCELGMVARDNIMILCKKRGITSPYYHCKSFLYAPLKRVPKKRPKIKDFKQEDFIL